MPNDAPHELRMLLEDIKSDPLGWSPIDLGKALDLAGFETRHIQDAEGWPQTYRYHPQLPAANVVLSPVERCHSAVALRVVHVIEEVLRRRD